MKEQCLLKIDHAISVMEFDGKDVKWDGLFYKADSVSIPAGEHSIGYYSRVGSGSRVYDFKPGYTYRMEVNPVSRNVSIFEEAGEPRSVITARENQLLGLGITVRSPGTGGGAVWAGQHGTVIDSDIVSTGLYWDVGFGFGAPVDTDINPFFITYTGVSTEFYLPGKSFGLGVGAGIASPDCFLFDFSPYLRATLIPFKRIIKLKLYFEYYLPVVEYVKIKDEHGKEFDRNDWGLGLIWFQ
jgi:hypothetical protein